MKFTQNRGNTQKNKLFIIIPVVILMPLLIIWGYSKFLGLLNLSISSMSAMLGSIVSAVITSLTTLFIAKKKL